MYSYEGGIDELRATAAKAGLKFSRKDIQEFDKVWFSRFPVAAEWRQRQARMAVRNRIVVCREWGYTRRLHGQDEAKLKNVALNHPQQAGIAGIINRTVREVAAEWTDRKDDGPLVPLANMHDGLVYQVEQENLDLFVRWVKTKMEQPLTSVSGIVIPVDVKIGQSWGSGLLDWKETA
jgi:DNA polymerase I-like protein with 3'-5' exonuclease and polymerase domains